MCYLYATIKTNDFWSTVMGADFSFENYVDDPYLARQLECARNLLLWIKDTAEEEGRIIREKE